MKLNLPTENGVATISKSDDGSPLLAHWRCPLLARVCAVPLAPRNPNGWSYDGNEKAPTLAPSIKCHECGWHGFIRAGVLVEA